MLKIPNLNEKMKSAKLYKNENEIIIYHILIDFV